MRRLPLATVSALVLLATTSAVAQTVPVGTCFQSVPEGATGIVMNDIVCSSTPGTFVVELFNRATLDLNGHTLSGGELGVACRGRRCTITSTGSAGTIRNAEIGILTGNEARVRMTVNNVILENHSTMALIATRSRVRGDGVTIATSGMGIQGRSVRLANFTATGMQFDAIHAVRLRLDGCSITGNTGVGIESASATIRNCTVTGNDAGGDAIDVRTLRRPRVINTTCGRSQRFSSHAEDWDVCAND